VSAPFAPLPRAARKPVIGVLCCNEIAERPIQAVASRFIEPLSRISEATVLLVPALADALDAAALTDRLDGLLLTGSRSNVAARHYGGSGDSDDRLDVQRDVVALVLAERMIEAGRPVFGICRGLQELNVLFGGTLSRDLGEFSHHRDEDGLSFAELFDHSHDVALSQGGVLAAATGARRISSSGRVSRFANDMARNAVDSGRNADRTANSAERVAGDLTLIMADGNSVAEAMSALREETRLAAEAMRIAAARSHSATSDVEAMASSADQVGLMAELIRSVATKANLLALNATIEAARAGDVGLGFAVVANEMKGLARQTAEATVKVDRQVATIREVALGTQAALGEIVDAIGQIERHATLVDAAVHQHGAASADMHRGLKMALESLDAARAEMESLGGVAADAGRLAGTLNEEARLLGEDADGVDLALRQVVLHLRDAA
jgi:methyl-accepting chemotaxis protein